GMGIESIELYYQKGLLTNVADIYYLPSHRQTLLSLERFGEKSVNNLLEVIEKSKEMPFERVLFGLGIRYVGETVARKIAAHFGVIDSLASAGLDELTAVAEI